MIFAGIVAGGCGSRMKSANMPKQFLEIGGEPIIIRTAKAFIDCEKVDKVYIGIKPDWHEYMDELAEKFKLDQNNVKIIDGGENRNATVMNIIDEVSNEFPIGDDDIILTHDAVRPFVSRNIIEENIICAEKNKVCGTYLPAIDTIIKSADGKTVEKNLNRAELYQAQTPQTFNITALQACMSSLSKEELSSLTDTCGIFTSCGIAIKMVMGEPCNFKITTDFDLKIAKLIAENIKNM